MKYQKTIIVRGEPTAQKRHRHTSVGKFVRVYDPSQKDKEDFLVQIRKEAPQSPILGPLSVDITFAFSRPKSHYGTGKNIGILKANAPYYHISKPDRDNLDKKCLDAMSKIFWRDDAQVCMGRILKIYSSSPSVEINIQEL